MFKNKIGNIRDLFCLVLLISILGTNVEFDDSGLLKSSVLSSYENTVAASTKTVEAESEVTAIFQVTVSTDATSIKFSVENLGTSTDVEASIITQESIILREDAKMDQGAVHDFEAPKSGTVTTYTLELKDKNTGLTSTYSVTL